MASVKCIQKKRGWVEKVSSETAKVISANNKPKTSGGGAGNESRNYFPSGELEHGREEGRSKKVKGTSSATGSRRHPTVWGVLQKKTGPTHIVGMPGPENSGGKKNRGN